MIIKGLLYPHNDSDLELICKDFLPQDFNSYTEILKNLDTFIGKPIICFYTRTVLGTIIDVWVDNEGNIQMCGNLHQALNSLYHQRFSISYNLHINGGDIRLTGTDCSVLKDDDAIFHGCTFKVIKILV